MIYKYYSITGTTENSIQILLLALEEFIFVIMMLLNTIHDYNNITNQIEHG